MAISKGLGSQEQRLPIENERKGRTIEVCGLFPFEDSQYSW
jgi:hypothetical protein